MAGVEKQSRKAETDSVAATSSTSSQTPSGSPGKANSGHPLMRRWPLLLVAIWQLSLLWMVWTTANPVTLNQQQIRDADWIVRARLVDQESGRFEVLETLRSVGDFEKPAELTVGNARQLQIRSSSEYLVPLSRTSVRSGDFDVTPTHLPDEIPLIYPWNDSAKRQFEEILGTDR